MDESVSEEKLTARKTEIEKNRIAKENRGIWHKEKMEREDQRHKNIMEEIAALKKAGIKVFVRGNAQFINKEADEK
jgi:hypothetical protein